MKCPNCGAESTGAFCSFCGSELPKPSVNIINNYYGSINNYSPAGNPTVNNSYSQPARTSGVICPICRNNSITFNREPVGTTGLHRTVGLCQNCGNTWVASQDTVVSQKNKSAALILCIFLGYYGAHYFYVRRYGMAFYICLQ